MNASPDVATLLLDRDMTEEPALGPVAEIGLPSPLSSVDWSGEIKMPDPVCREMPLHETLHGDHRCLGWSYPPAAAERPVRASGGRGNHPLGAVSADPYPFVEEQKGGVSPADPLTDPYIDDI